MALKIRIAYLIDTISSDKAGTEKQLLNIIERLDRDVFEITLVCLHESPWMLRNRLPCEVLSLGYRGFLKPGFPAVMWRYLRVLNSRRFDVVQTFFEDSIFVGFLGKVLSQNKHSLIVSRRDLGLGSDEPGYHWIYKSIMPLIFGFIDGIATNAMAIKTNLIEQEKASPEKIQVIGNGIDVPVFSRNIPSIIQQYQSVIWLGIVANLKPVKRIDIFLRALAYIKDNGSGERVRAVVLGEGRLRPELVQLASDLGIAEQVHFAGALDNVNDYLHCIDIAVLCSDKEGLSNAILEYMACGLPVVVTGAGGNGELVDETNGECVPTGDPEALAKSLVKLIEAPQLRNKLGANSLEKVRQNFTWGKIIPQWESYYRSLVPKQVPGSDLIGEG
ncbi:glycosyltransferase [Oryzomonas rubra]|uniref:Glycosyltransferase n=1 Tax=Oryzomonas rubra TaxID=2509454 RepID=A0A5A9XDI0_9BACT|nr:glycosyltransferase [Oryzomonas rubra]KAA0890505.1 glycosyltransferase [Oryzomonas rubra]